MFYRLILVDFILFVYIYIGTRWVGWSLEQTLASKAGFLLLIISALMIAKEGLEKPVKVGKLFIVIGIVLLLTGYAISLQIRQAQHFVLVEGESLNQPDGTILLKKVNVQDSPGLIRNDVYAWLLFKKSKFTTDNTKEELVTIMPPSFINGNFWRIIRFGYAPILSLDINNKLTIKNQSLILAMENWTSEAETRLIEAGLSRKPPTRIMLGVGAFPPEMEALVNLNQFGRTGENLFIRLTKTTFNGKQVSLEGDDYWRYLVNGRLRDPVLKIGLIKNKKLTKIQEVKIGDLLKWNNNSVRFDDLKYWVEIERRWDPFIPVIIASFLITYLGVAISTIQYVVSKIKRKKVKSIRR